MKLGDVNGLVEGGGVLSMTALESGAKVAYKLFLFRKEITKAYDSIKEQEHELLEENNIDVIADFDSEGKFKSDSEEKAEKWNRFSKLRAEMFATDYPISVPMLTYDEWFLVYKENKARINPFVEGMLEGILWKAEETVEEK